MQSEAWQSHLQWMRIRGLSPDTISQREGVMRRLAAFFDGRPLLSLTERDLMNWADSLVDVKALATRAVYVSNVRSFYGWCYDEQRVPTNPAARLPVPRAPTRQPRPMSEDDLADALANCDGRVRIWIVLAAFAGLRAKEIALLRAENIHLHDNPPGILVASESTKGVKERTVPLNPYVVDELSRYPLPRRGPCWLTRDEKPVNRNLVSWVCNHYLHGLGIDSPLHSGRHRFGTQIQREGHDLRITQELLGHSSPATTAGYAQVADDDKYRAVSRLPVPATYDPANVPTIPMRAGR